MKTFITCSETDFSDDLIFLSNLISIFLFKIFKLIFSSFSFLYFLNSLENFAKFEVMCGLNFLPFRELTSQIIHCCHRMILNQNLLDLPHLFLLLIAPILISVVIKNLLVFYWHISIKIFLFPIHRPESSIKINKISYLTFSRFIILKKF